MSSWERGRPGSPAGSPRGVLDPSALSAKREKVGYQPNQECGRDVRAPSSAGLVSTLKQ